jgi:hypothetical protein
MPSPTGRAFAPSERLIATLKLTRALRAPIPTESNPLANPPDLRLPALFHRPLEFLAGLDADAFRQFRLALEELDPAAGPDVAAERLVEVWSAEDDPVQLSRVLEFGLSTRALIARWSHSVEIISQAVVAAYEGSSDSEDLAAPSGEASAAQSGDTLYDRVLALLTSPYVTYHEKVIRLTNAADMTIRNATCISDLRPIFEETTGRQEIIGFLVLHMLQLDVAGSGEQQSLFLNLDTGSLERLRDVIDRALKKGANLTDVVGKAGFRDLTLVSGGGDD